jgi:large subunit ribosomal protein L24
MAKEIAKPKMHVKKGDTVIVISGKDTGKKGKIIDVDAKNGRVYVDKVNVVSRHTKPTKGAPQGGIVKQEAALHSSNVMLYCGRCGMGVRIAKDIAPDGHKQRVCVKCGTRFDK